MITEYKVQESEMMKFISPKAFRYAKEKYELYQHTSSDKTKRLVHFIHATILKQLLDNEKRLCTELSYTLTFSRMYELDDLMILKVVSRKLRPKNETEYKDALIAAITTFKPSGMMSQPCKS